MLPSKVLNKFTIAKNLPDDLLPYLSPSAIPIVYGGEYQGFSDINDICSIPEPILPSDLKVCFRILFFFFDGFILQHCQCFMELSLFFLPFFFRNRM